MSRDNLTIKQMMPIPDGYEVMNRIVQRDGSEEMEATVNSLFPYCLALVEDKEIGDRIELYGIGLFGNGVEDCAESFLVPTRYCPKCGKRMIPHMHGIDEDTLYYVCGCGYNSENDSEHGETEEENSEDTVKSNKIDSEK